MKKLLNIIQNDKLGIIFISLLFGLCSLLILSCEKKENIKSQTNVAKSAPEQILKNFTAFESKAGKKVWSLVAESAEVFDKVTLIQNFTIKFYSENGKSIDGILKASKGEINTEKNEFKTIGKTFLNSSAGEKLECSNLYYNPQTKKIYSDNDVKLERIDAIVTGK
ncbi:MAG: LPS export ABC transporter periplasmic protein LptC, partial [Elusimicrobiota bacterium]|nr:LPS export ABC transporter periplasmic protein LptC [Elusimicrobiota bacterium]